MYKGTLIPIGGAEDKGVGEGEQETEFVKDGILSQVVKEAGGVESNILVVPTASMIPKEVAKNYKSALKKLFVKILIYITLLKESNVIKSQFKSFLLMPIVFFSLVVTNLE